MSDYFNVCKRLQEAVSVENIPEYASNSEIICVNEDLNKKVKVLNYLYNTEARKPKKVTFASIGICEIGHFTGNQLLRVFVSICNNQDCNKLGNYISLSINKEAMSVLIFINTLTATSVKFA